MKVSSTVRRGDCEKVPGSHWLSGNSSLYPPYLYMGSSWPIISTWKQQNPQAVGNVMMGLFFVLFASLVVSIIPNPGGFQ